MSWTKSCPRNTTRQVVPCECVTISAKITLTPHTLCPLFPPFWKGKVLGCLLICSSSRVVLGTHLVLSESIYEVSKSNGLRRQSRIEEIDRGPSMDTDTWRREIGRGGNRSRPDHLLQCSRLYRSNIIIIMHYSSRGGRALLLLCSSMPAFGAVEHLHSIGRGSMRLSLSERLFYNNNNGPGLEVRSILYTIIIIIIIILYPSF